MSRHRTGAEIRSQLGYPVIDSDGHHVEFIPEIMERVEALGGRAVRDSFGNVVNSAGFMRSLDAGLRRQLGLIRIPFWGLPAANTLDRATAMLPRLLHERLPQLGIDFAVLYPTYGLTAIHLYEAEVRQVTARAFNDYAAEAFAPYADRLTPAACIPMDTPEEALAELDHAVGKLGLKTVMLSGFASRAYEGENMPRGARWLDFFGFDSPYDYDPVWQRCRELRVSPTFHSTGMGWGSRSSLSNYVYNHIGNFAAAGEGTSRALFLSGVPRRFPELRFAFLEGGVSWAASLFSDLIGHFEKRNREHIRHYDPARIDRGKLEELFGRYGTKEVAARMDRLDEALHFLSEPDEDPAVIDEFVRSGIESAEDIRDTFVSRFHFGCEADDPMNAIAFDRRTNPFGARLKAIFSSDIGHWDVPDMNEVLEEAFELVERSVLSEEDFRDFVFTNPVSLWAGTNPEFFRGTVVERSVEPIAARA